MSLLSTEISQIKKEFFYNSYNVLSLNKEYDKLEEKLKDALSIEIQIKQYPEKERKLLLSSKLFHSDVTRCTNLDTLRTIFGETKYPNMMESYPSFMLRNPIKLLYPWKKKENIPEEIKDKVLEILSRLIEIKVTLNYYECSFNRLINTKTNITFLKENFPDIYEFYKKHFTSSRN